MLCTCCCFKTSIKCKMVRMTGESARLSTFLLGHDLTSAVAGKLNKHLVSCTLDKDMPGSTHLLRLPRWLPSSKRETCCPMVQATIGLEDGTFRVSAARPKGNVAQPAFLPSKTD